MELKEYIKILKNNAKIFWGVVILIVAGSFAYFYLRPVFYDTSLTLNVTRSGTQQTDQYKYDDFYRLQADEKFAETIEEWLKSPRTVAEIYAKAGINPAQFTLRQLSKTVKAEKLSSQIVAVNFSTANPETAKNISNSISEIISKKSESLNSDQKEESWFKIIADDAVIVKAGFDPFLVFIVTLALGIFLAFWAVLVSHYIK